MGLDPGFKGQLATGGQRIVDFARRAAGHDPRGGVQGQRPRQPLGVGRRLDGQIQRRTHARSVVHHAATALFEIVQRHQPGTDAVAAGAGADGVDRAGRGARGVAAAEGFGAQRRALGELEGSVV